MKALFFYFITFLLYSSLKAQEYSYVHYDAKDGLAGSNVYHICQDKDGFMWFATETGVSRFDGARFKNFTTQDGLPDNEILLVFPDSKGRVWMSLFNKSVCYYYKGKIYTANTDSTLKKIKLTEYMIGLIEDKNGVIALADRKFVTIISPRGEVKRYSIAEITNNRLYTGNIAVFSVLKKKIGIIITTNEKNFYYFFKNDSFLFVRSDTVFLRKVFPFDPLTTFSRYGFNLKPDRELVTKKNNISFTGLSVTDAGYITYSNTTNGSWSIDTSTGKYAEHFLAGKKVSYTLEDNEGNIWFSTLGEGVYKLPSKQCKTIRFETEKNYINTEIFSLGKHQNSLVAGLGSSIAKIIKNNKVAGEWNFQNDNVFSKNNGRINRLYCIKELSNRITFLGFDNYFTKLEKGKLSFNRKIIRVKSIAEINKEYILVGTGTFAYKVRVSDLAITDTIWKERCTSVFYYNRHYYIGTLNGLYEVAEDKSFRYLGDIYPVLKKRINDIKLSSDGTLWIATNNEGIIGYKDGKVVAVINTGAGMSSNICKTLFIKDNYLWAGTSKGLNKIDMGNPRFPVTKYSIFDGLASDIINAVYVEDSMVYVGSPAGLTYFNEKKMSSFSRCDLRVLGVTISGKDTAFADKYNLSYKDNNFKIDFVAISFKSGGDITYRYKLTSLDKDWQETTETSLSYPSLPSGKYELQLMAINKFGVKSEEIKIKISISTPFWKTPWFYGLLLLTAAGATGWLVNRKNKMVQKRTAEKNTIQYQFAALEQQALQAQMNPHFIFNCLNSIQQFILTDEKEKANQYLTGFASLIRKTLESSEKKTITVAEETAYLGNYLEMEAMRFGDNFNFEITVAPSIHAGEIEIPALLLQPFVENCLRHGIRYKKEGVGKVDISFSMEQDILYCRIKDNGIGRKKAAEYKSRQHIEYQSKGINLTEKRVTLLNKINDNKILIEIIDLEDKEGNAAGTEVIVKIPV